MGQAGLKLKSQIPRSPSPSQRLCCLTADHHYPGQRRKGTEGSPHRSQQERNRIQKEALRTSKEVLYLATAFVFFWISICHHLQLSFWFWVLDYTRHYTEHSNFSQTPASKQAIRSCFYGRDLGQDFSRCPSSGMNATTGTPGSCHLDEKPALQVSVGKVACYICPELRLLKEVSFLQSTSRNCLTWEFLYDSEVSNILLITALLQNLDFPSFSKDLLLNIRYMKN